MPKVLTDKDFEEGAAVDTSQTGDRSQTQDNPPADGGSGGSGEVNADQVFDADQEFNENGEPVGEPSGETGSQKAKDGEEPPKPSFKPKHKSWEETESARAEAERKMHEATGEAAELRRRLESYEKPKPDQTQQPTLDDRTAEIMDAALEEVKKIPIQYDDQGKPTLDSINKYNREYALIMGKANRKVSRLEIEEENRRVRDGQDTVKTLYTAATKGGLKTEDELEMVGNEFTKLSHLAGEDRVKTAVENVKGRISRLREGFVKSQQKTKEETDSLRVLGGGSRRKVTGADEGKVENKPVTMSEQLAQMNESRRLKKDDLWH